MVGSDTINSGKRWTILYYFILTFLLLSLVVGGIMYIFYRSDTRYEKHSLEIDQKNRLSLDERTISISLRPIVTDLMVLVDHYEVRQFFDAADPATKNLEHELVSFVNRKGVYNQVRLLDNSGMEQVRVNYSDGTHYVVPKEELQDKSHRYYFKEAIKLDENEIYISPLDLNMENRVVELPEKPMIRASTPLFDEKGERKGIIVINYLAKTIFDYLERGSLGITGDIYLLDSKGYWLFSATNKEDTFGFMYEDNKEVSLKNRYPEIWEKMTGVESGQFYTDTGFYTFKLVRPFLKGYGASVNTGVVKNKRFFYWVLMSHVTSEELGQISNRILFRVLKAYVFLLIIIAFGTFMLARVSYSKKITETELKESQDRIRAISESAQDAIMMFDQNGVITYWNESAEKIYGYSKKEVVGRETFRALAGESDHEKYSAQIEELQRQGINEYVGETTEFKGIRKDGTEISVEASVSTVKISGYWHTIAIVRDISERKMVDNLLYNIAYGVTGTSGEASCVSLVKYMTKIMDIDYAFIGELFGPDYSTVKTIAVSKRGEMLDNFEYVLKGTPCESVLSGNMCVFPKNVSASFPTDDMLRDMGIESYAGIQLKDSNGKAIGILVMLGEAPFHDWYMIETLLQIFSTKATAELERMNIMQVLRNSESNLRAAQKIAHIGSWERNIETGELTWSDEVYRIFGLNPKEITPDFDTFLRMIHPDDLEHVKRSIHEAYNKKPYGIDFRIVMDDGQEKIVNSKAIVKFDKDDKPVTMTGTIQDITGQKRIEEELKRSESRLKAIFNSVNDAIFILDMKGVILDVNDVACERLGYTKEELTRMTVKDIESPAFAKKIPGKIDEIIDKGGGVIISEHVTSDGRKIPVEINTRVIEYRGAQAFLSVIRDITARKEAEEQRRRDYLNKIGVMVVVVNKNRTVDFINRAGQGLLGYEMDEVIGKDWYENFIVNGSSKEEVSNFFDIVDAEKDYVNYFENRVRTKSGAEKVIFWNSMILKDEHGEDAGVIYTGEDVTDKKIVAKELVKGYHNQLALNSLLKLPVEHISLTTLLERSLDILLSIKWLNVLESCCVFLIEKKDKKMLMMQAFRGLSASMIKTCSRVPFGMCICGQAAQSRDIVFADKIDTRHTITFEDMTPHGHYAVPIMSEGGLLGVLCLYLEEGRKKTDYDISFLEAFASTMAVLIRRKQSDEEKSELWQQLLQAQKLESVGRLTGGLAHDFNNILTTTIGFSSLALEKLPYDHPVRDMVERIYKSGTNASKLIDQLLSFSKKQLLDMQPRNINSIVDNTLEMLSRTIGEDITLKTEMEPLIKSIMADDTQIEQVFMNLVINARHAMPDGGTVTIETYSATLDEEYALSHHGVMPGEYIVLAISDTGTGMTAQVKDRIFEPFFTTKQEGKGTGLGLSTVYGIVEQHNGFIQVESVPDEGTRFEIYLPAASEDAVPIPKEKGYHGSFKGNETILVVEDDDSVRKLFVDVLTPLGYRIIEAESGEEALQLCNSTEGKIELILTDVVMPGINGWDLAEKVTKKIPTIKEIFTSGFVENPIVIDKIQSSGKPFLKKPLSPRSLARAVREVLDSKPIS